MMPAKYYIYAGGRWCEVDTKRGRVAGFRQRARFCFLRGGKLEVGRSAAVLKALRALAVGAGGAARDSAPLLGRRPRRSRQQSVRSHQCCSQHLRHSRCDANANDLIEKLPPLPATERKRKRSTSEDSHKLKRARNIGTKQALLLEKQCQTSPQTTKRGKEEIQSLVSSSEDKEKKQSPQKKKTGVTVRDKEVENLVQSLIQSSSEESSKEQKKPSPQKKPRPRVREREEKVSQRSSESEKNKKCLKIKPKRIVRGSQEDELVRSLLESSSEDDEQIPSKASHKPAPKSKKHTETETSSSESSEHRQACKELVIDDSDVKVLRRFLARGAGGDELERFDKDEEYKTRVFYKLNPLVVLKRCGPLEQLLLQRLSLKEFARHLGLRSVADVTPEKRYRMRHSTRHARNATSVTSDSENESENAVHPKRRQLWNRDKELFNSLRSSRSSELMVKPQIHRPQDRDSDTEVKKHIKRHLERRASAKINPRREEKDPKNKENNDSIAVYEKSTDDNTTNKSSSNTDENRGKSRLRTRGMKGDDQFVVVSDENSSDRRRKSRNTRRRIRRVKAGDQSVVISDESDGDGRGKSGNTRRRTREMKNSTKSVAVSDETDSDVDENRAKSRHKAGGEKEDNKSLKSVVVSDETDSDVDENRQTSRSRARGKKENKKSAVVSDESDGNLNEKRRKSKSKSRAKNKNEDNNKSVVISDESDSNTDENIDDDVRTARRTRSHGPEKRVLREHNKSVVISDDTDSYSNKNRAKFRTKAMEPDSESDAVNDDSNSNTDDIRETRRTRSKGPDINLKEQNRTDNKVTKETEKKATKDVDESTETRKITRSSIKSADDSKPVKGIHKPDARKDEKQSTAKNHNKRKENEAAPSNSKENPKKHGDKSVISDSDDAFETPKFSPKETQTKNLGKKIAAHKIRNDKGRFVKPTNVKESKTIEKEKDLQRDNKITGRGNELNNNKDKHRSGNESDRDKSKVRDNDRIDNANKENSKAENKGNDNVKIAAAVARNMFIKPVKFKKSSVANGREYTSLEDHAIVAWVSVGNRERLVNGNAVWRELETEYHRLTSQKRTWHSLRNRYLRYILPALAALALPPAQVSRLRAAAAQGCIKVKALKNGSRRNSIFSAPRVRSAAAAGRPRTRHGPGSDSEPSSDDKKERTPPPRRAPHAPFPPKTRSTPAKPPKAPLTPVKATSTPAKATSTPTSPPRSARLRARTSPTPKKRRIHHL